MIIVKTCPRCGSIDKRTSGTGPGFTEFECQMCGKLFFDSEATLREFIGEKKPPRAKTENPWLFPELDRKGYR